MKNVKGLTDLLIYNKINFTPTIIGFIKMLRGNKKYSSFHTQIK
jgi:hypothetical protein